MAARKKSSAAFAVLLAIVVAAMALASSPAARYGPQGPGRAGEGVDGAPDYRTQTPLESPIRRVRSLTGAQELAMGPRVASPVASRRGVRWAPPMAAHRAVAPNRPGSSIPAAGRSRPRRRRYLDDASFRGLAGTPGVKSFPGKLRRAGPTSCWLAPKTFQRVQQRSQRRDVGGVLDLRRRRLPTRRDGGQVATHQEPRQATPAMRSRRRATAPRRLR